nr:hypothetical protein Q903MT_gene3267 [Picea sitchensis]
MHLHVPCHALFLQLSQVNILFARTSQRKTFCLIGDFLFHTDFHHHFRSFSSSTRNIALYPNCAVYLPDELFLDQTISSSSSLNLIALCFNFCTDRVQHSASSPCKPILFASFQP